MSYQPRIGVFVAAFLVSCGEPPCAGEPFHDLMPLAVGGFWEFEETGGPLDGTVTKTLIGSETYEGVDTYVWETVQTNSLVTKRSNWHDDGRRIVRLRQQRFEAGLKLSTRTYDPGFLRVDRSLDALGESRVETHTRVEYDAGDRLLTAVSKSYAWAVEMVDEDVTVPAGTFSCVRVLRTDADNGEVKTFWYARDVGKVKELGPLNVDGTQEVEILTRYGVE